MSLSLYVVLEALACKEICSLSNLRPMRKDGDMHWK